MKIMTPFLYLAILVDLILKGISLYKSARREQKGWFIALLLVNSFGILPTIYLFINKDIVFKKTEAAMKKTVKKAKR